MAVYTQIGAEAVSQLLAKYDAGELIAMKGIAEGVENSNYFIETTRARYILTLYEKRVDPKDLPFFFAMLDHLHHAGCKVPRFITDISGQWLQEIGGRPACLIEFLSGVSVTIPNAKQAYATGAALGSMHSALESFNELRPNSLGVNVFTQLAEKCGVDGLNSIQDGLAQIVFDECTYIKENWPHHLPISAIHADLFLDNVLMLGNNVSGLIDFYFACTDVRTYDLAVTHAAWSFSADGTIYNPKVGDAIIKGYESAYALDKVCRKALPILTRGACLRFLLTRCYDWINTPASAIVTRKDPIAFLRRLDFYRNNAIATFKLGATH
jgi:homoserine kinase type II